eukprot:1463322-Amphidinium_carterae.4
MPSLHSNICKLGAWLEKQVYQRNVYKFGLCTLYRIIDCREIRYACSGVASSCDKEHQKSKALASKLGVAFDDGEAKKCLAHAHALKVESQLVSLLSDKAMPSESRKMKIESVIASIGSYTEEYGQNVKSLILNRLIFEGINSSLGSQAAVRVAP